MITKCARCKKPKANSVELCAVCFRLSKLNPPKPPKYVARWNLTNMMHRLDVPEWRDARRMRWRKHRVLA